MNPLYRKTQFLLSAPDLRAAPLDAGREVAFAGRSNAGKSSAINVLTEQRSLARTSKTPGRTRQIVFFRVDEVRRLVDLPGYGYAKVGESVRRHWQEALERYLRERQSLRGVLLMMDIRHPLTDYDRAMLNWCGHAGLPVHVLLTKADKLKRGPANATLLKLRKALGEFYGGCSVQLFSALKRTGIDEAHGVLDSWLEFKPGE